MTTPTETPSPATCPGCGGPTTFSGTIGTFCGNKGCERVDDMRPAPSLTTEQARDLAARWAEAMLGSGSLSDVLDWQLTDPEREQLFAWVRARMVELIDESGAWQERHTTTMRNWLAMRVGIDLGIDGGADALCESSGWPS